MRNQKGEAILFCVLILVALSGLLTLCSLELQHHFSSMKKRTTLFLCVKETKGELNLYLKSMGRLNWLLQNVSRAQMIAVFYPPLWPVVGNAEKLKKVGPNICSSNWCRNLKGTRSEPFLGYSGEKDMYFQGGPNFFVSFETAEETQYYFRPGD